MSTKAVIQALINTKLADNSDIVASEHREVENELLNNLYATPIKENHLTVGAITSSVGVGKNYSITILKQGRLVTLNVLIQSAILGTFVSQDWININNLEYQMFTPESPYLVNTINQQTGLPMFVELLNNKIRVLSPISFGNTISFQIQYFTNN